MDKWYDKDGINDDVVVYGRVRLARNFEEYPFLDRISSETASKMVKSVIERFKKDYQEKYSYYYMDNCNEIRKGELRAKTGIKASSLPKTESGMILSPDESLSVLINGEDHVRIQAMCSGMNLNECFRKADETDDYIDENFNYAFDEKYGYKTAYPTNIGTGLRAEYVLHLPSLKDAGKISHISTEVGRFGIMLKPLYGEGNDRTNTFFRISSRRSIGLEEKEIIQDLDNMVCQLVSQEREQGRIFYSASRIGMEDEIYKSYGVLKYARKLSYKDSLMLISEIKKGISLGILKTADGRGYNINRIMMNIKPSVIKASENRTMTEAETDVARAEYLRETIPEIV